MLMTLFWSILVLFTIIFTILFYPTSLDEESVQDIDLEIKGKFVQEEDPSKHSEDHFKGKGKDKECLPQRRKRSIAVIMR